MIKIDDFVFGKTSNGKVVKNYVLKSSDIEVVLSEYGANINSIKVPAVDGEKVDVVLGYDDLAKYERQEKYIGATVGRCCNRIKDGKFGLNSKEYFLFCNDGNNHLHGGKVGFDKRVWSSEIVDSGVKFSYYSPNMEEGYPGNLDVSVIYTISDKGLKINYVAKSDEDTICALTNHSYFNLSGFDSGDVLEQEVQILADYYTENDENSIPTGRLISVSDTPMDFRQLKSIGRDINENYYQLNFAKGFDQNWCINSYDGTIKKAAAAFSKKTGITLEVYTDMAGVQFYTGNFLDGAENGKLNSPIKNRSAFCLECQNYPDAINHKNFPQPILKSGEIYNKHIEYRFS